MKDKEVDQKVIDQISSSIEEGNAVIGKEHETIIVIGDTGSGKSTLINYLSGVPLIAKKTLVGLSESFIINTKKVGEGVKIGDTTVAETTVPNNWKDNANGIVYWDCPGFKDTRGPVQDIPNAFYIKKVFDNSDILKIVVVVEASAFSSVRGQPFVTQIELLSHLFKNIDDFKNGLSLVITKVPPGATIEVVKAAIARILTEQQDELTPDQMKIGKFLASVDSKVALFTLPQTEGPLLLENRDILLSTIADTQSVNKAEVNVPISTESRLYVMELFNKTSLKVTELLKEKFLDVKLKHAQLLDVENLSEVAKLVGDTKELKELFFSAGENMLN